MRLMTVNALSVETGRDRRTIAKRLRDVEPDEIRGNQRLYDLDRVEDLLLEDQNDEMNFIRVLINSAIGIYAAEAIDAAANVLRVQLSDLPAKRVSAVIAAASVAQADAWKAVISADRCFEALEDKGDADALARSVLRPGLVPKGKTSPNRRMPIAVSASILAEIAKNGPVPSYIMVIE